MSEKTQRYCFELIVEEKAKKESAMFKKLSLDLVFLSPQLHQLEKKGDIMLKKIFETFIDNYIHSATIDLHLLPHNVEHNVQNTSSINQSIRVLCDYIAGMTDGFAIRTYKRLFDPDFGSLADLV